MKLVFLYGPPAVGKLTVAKELAAITGYKVFHNHLTFDLASELFEPLSKAFSVLCDELRFRTFELAAQLGLEGMVFTFCYAYPHDNAFVDRVRQIIVSAGGEVCFVQLVADLAELKRRVVAPDRRSFGKLCSLKGLEDVASRWDLETPTPDSGTLRIDNTRIPPPEVVRQIVEHFGLPHSD
jgi:hypothetical protein